MNNYNYENLTPNNFREATSPSYNYLSQSANEIYKRDRRYFPVTNYKNIESNISTLIRPPNFYSSIQSDWNPLNRTSKSQRFQNENPTIYRVSPYHYQYISRLNNNNINNDNIYQKDYNYQEDNINGDQSYNIERERKFKNYNQYIDSRSINRHLNYLERNDYYKKNKKRNFRNYNDINYYNQINKSDLNLRKNNDTNIKYPFPKDLSNRENRNNRYSNHNEEIPFSQSDSINNGNYINENDDSNNRNIRKSFFNKIQRGEENRKYMMRRNNSDMNLVYNNNYNNDRYIQNERYRNQSQRKYEQNDFNENTERNSYAERMNYYRPDKNDYKGSRYGDYTYNYYLNGPMRGDISEDWRFPPIYFYRPNKNIRKNLYPSISDENDIKEKFFNDNV